MLSEFSLDKAVVLIGGKPPKTLAKGHVSSDSSGVQTSWRLHITYHCHEGMFL